MSAKQNILKYLTKGKELTTKQARVLFRIKNVHARIHELRSEGHVIYTNERKLYDGTKTKAYRLGKPQTHGKDYTKSMLMSA